jgi:hypothetical protein
VIPALIVLAVLLLVAVMLVVAKLRSTGRSGDSDLPGGPPRD